MNYQVNLNPLKPYKRSVSIIGIGATPFMVTKDNPETNGLGEGELFGYAAIEAMKDAGITARDVDFFMHAEAGPKWMSGAETPAMHVANWFGMKGKPNLHHSEACCTGYVALEIACAYVASGMYDIVLTGGCDMAESQATMDKPSHMRRSADENDFQGALLSIYPKDYTLAGNAAANMSAEAWLDEYVHENGLEDRVDDLMCTMAKNSRRAASLNPLSRNHDDFDQVAQQFRMKDADEFLRSKFNPRLGQYLRVANFEQRADGAAALIICPTEMAWKYTDHPVEVLGIGHSCLEGGTPLLEKQATIAAYEQVKALTGLTGRDMDLFMVNDFIMPSQLLAAEACEYLPRNEGWKYFMEGRTNFDGDRPVQTNGGRCHYGHASGTSGLHDAYEAIMQMRGKIGPTQVQHPVKHAMLRGFGGGQNLTCAILKYL